MSAKPPIQGLRVALIHYWLVTWRGGEQVLRALADVFPEADLYFHVADPTLVAERFPGRRVRTTFISRLPGALRRYQSYLPLMPLALEQLDLRQYDLVLSSESGPAKGVVVRPDALHVCYCHSPMRYAWDMYHDYVALRSRLARLAIAPLMHYMRNWDQLSAQRVDHFIANSAFVASRIRKYYRRDSVVLHPPVDVDRFVPGTGPEDFYLWVGQLVGYKRPDLAVDAFNASGRRLVVIGEGELAAQLRSRARGNIQFLGRQDDATIADYLSRCRALVFPGREDFGIVPVEAMAAGRPVVGYGSGGLKETVVDGVTGVLFQEQTPSALNEAIERLERLLPSLDPAALRAHAERFSPARFDKDLRALIERWLG